MSKYNRLNFFYLKKYYYKNTKVVTVLTFPKFLE